MKKLDGKTKDLVQGNIEKLKELFPDAFSEDKIDFEQLRSILGDEVDVSDERYQFTWNGKQDAIKMALKQSTGTLRPNKDESKDWDTTQNLFIEGDNLEVLRLLQDSYRNKVKMIYIDPPYNTGHDFVYNDDFRDNIKNYKEQTGTNMQANADSSGRYHTNWLNMMYPRLRLARNLLKNDGVIFISIDDNEVHNLRKICDEIFGEEHFEAQIIPISNPGGRDYKQIAVTNEYLLAYARSEFLELNEITKDIEFALEDSLGGYNPRDLRNRNPKFHSGNRPNLFYPFYVNPSACEDGYCNVSLEKIDDYSVEVKPYNSTGKESVWRWGTKKAAENIVLSDFDTSQLIAKQKADGNWNIYEKNRRSTTKVKSIWDDTEMRTENGTREFRDLFSASYFDHPKPIKLIKRCTEIGTNKEDLVIDFFAGSATTAHSIMVQNAEDGGNRKSIMVQLPETTPEDSEARKAGYETIADIGKERIRRAGEKVKTDFADKLVEREDPLDVGFKVFKLDETNFKLWDPEASDVEQSLLDQLEPLKDERIDEDALYEILLKYGIDLSLPIKEVELGGKKVYSMADNFLLVCLEKEVGLDTVSEMAKLTPHRVVFYDKGFATDTDKANAESTLKKAGVEDIMAI